MNKNCIITACVAVVATFVVSEKANAQNRQVANCLAKKAEVYWASEGKSPKMETPTALQSQKTFFYDKEELELTAPAIHNGKQDELILNWNSKIRRNATSGWGLGLQGGVIQMAENFSPAAGLDLTFAGKRFLVGASAEAAISKYNSESSKAGQSFIAPIFSARAGIVLKRFSLGGYDNMGYIAAGYEFKYILDKNENKTNKSTYEGPNESYTTSDRFYVEGNSMCHVGFFEARFALKHMGSASIGAKAFGGVYNRYYEEGSRRKAMFGASVSLYFSGAKKRSDKDVAYLRSSMESVDYELANQIINQVRATMK
jgi:hypothetical protein